MGVYLNPGNDMFCETVRGEIYVDKTELIRETNRRLKTPQKFVCISRARRFGKSMAAYMLAAYYGKNCDSKELFAPYKIAKCDSYEKYLNKYNVIMLNIQDFLSMMESVEEMLSLLQKRVIKELKKQYPGLIADDEWLLTIALEDVYSETGEAFVFIIDEWDCILRDRSYNADDQKKYLDFIRNLLKDKAYVALAYMTGILPIKKYGTHSALNMFDEYSMIDAGDFQEFVGFTEEEVRALCEQYQVDFDTMQSWYDGYTFPSVPHVYNPKSVVDSIRRKRFGSYWTQTETYEALKVYIDIDYAGLKDDIIRMLSGERVQIHTDRFQNDMTTLESKDDVLTLLVHLGYLAYDSESSEVFIPNTEIRGEFRNAITGDHWKDIATALETSDRLLRATWDGDAETVAELLDAAHMENTSILTYNNENSLSCVIAIAYYSAMKDYTMIWELPSGKGYADIVFLPKRFSNKPALIVELKCGESPEGALTQIREKNYADSMKDYKGNLILVGINYDKKTKKHDCMIEKIEK
ncbi:MAG: AAA family ATPase [Lachnospiraceae bacterium]|nr:AAA family ATPase [bacterium]MDY5518201.1 AAA family ATPase [Lachnospiraceae bacterium]